jgi:hypothetical protein
MVNVMTTTGMREAEALIQGANRRMGGDTKHVLLREAVRFDAWTYLGCSGVNIGVTILRILAAYSESHLLPSAFLDIPRGGWLVIEAEL